MLNDEVLEKILLHPNMRRFCLYEQTEIINMFDDVMEQMKEENLMQQYQSYYQTPMFNQQQNPYMQRMDYLQQFQQSLQQPVPNNNQFVPMGKIVESVDMVKATDIPMDGNMYYFPTADGSSIFGKRWLSNGQTQIMAFKPILEDEPNNSSLNVNEVKFEPILDLLDILQNDIKELSAKVDKISKPSRGKKEVAEDGE